MGEKIVVYDRKGNRVVLERMLDDVYSKLDADGNRTASTVNLKVALACNAYFTEEQHSKFLAKQKEKEQKKNGRI